MAERGEEPEIEVEDGAGPVSPAAAIALGLRKGRAGNKPDPKLDAFLDEQTRLVRLQTEHLHEQRELQLAHLRVRRWKDRMSLALQALGVLVGAAIVVGLGVTAWQAHEDQSLVIAPFATPPALAQQGLTGAALGGELMDRLAAIVRTANGASLSTSSGVKADSNEDVKLEIPETGVSIGEVGRLLRDWIGRQRKVEGELRQTADGKLLLTARMGGRAFSASGAPADLDKLEQQVAEQIFAAADPSNDVIYLDASGRRLEARDQARRMAVTYPDALPLWATEEYLIDPVRDLALARMAARVAPTSPYSHFELARAEALFGHDEASLASEQRLLAVLATNRPRELQGPGRDFLDGYPRGLIAELRGDFAAAEAADMMDKYGPGAAARTSRDAAQAHDLGRARELLEPTATTSQNEDTEVLVARARAAIAAEAGDWAAVAAAGAVAAEKIRAIHAKDPEPEGAARFAQTDAAEDGPMIAEARARLGDFAGAQASLAAAPADCYACLRERGRIAALQRDWPEAERWFAEAVREGPSLPLAYADWGEMLLARGDPEGAIAKLELAVEKGPRFADPLVLWGEALMARRHFAEAAGKFAAASAISPKWGRDHLEWGEALMLAGRYRGARAQFETASTLDLGRPDRAALNVLLARTAKGPLHG